MTMKLLLTRILQRELAARNVQLLAPRDCENIIDRLLEQITELELKLASREISKDTLR